MWRTEFPSRRNRVARIETAAGPAVEKQFRDAESAKKEIEVYRLLAGTPLPHAQVLAADSEWLRLSLLPGVTFTELLEQQEQAGTFDFAPWKQLADWVMAFHRLTGLMMTDCNLRNFLYEEKTQTAYGLDFEECCTGNVLEMAAQLCAFVPLYAPEHTPMKRELAERLQAYFAQELPCDKLWLAEMVTASQRAIQKRREQK